MCATHVRLTSEPVGCRYPVYHPSSIVVNEIVRRSVYCCAYSPAERVIYVVCGVVGIGKTGYSTIRIVCIASADTIVRDVARCVINYAAAGNLIVRIKSVLRRWSTLRRILLPSISVPVIYVRERLLS